jgi:hypothetical protein
VQNHIRVSTINPVVLCKCDLTSLALDCSAQQTNIIIIAKYELKTAPTVGEGNFVQFAVGLDATGSPTPKVTLIDRGTHALC